MKDFQNDEQVFHKWCCKSLEKLNDKNCNQLIYSRKQSIPSVPGNPCVR